MTDIFEEDDLIENEAFESADEEIVDIDTSETATLDARRRLEKMLEEKRLRDELDDFVDY